jgi:chromate transport protein ChrA
MLGAALLLVRKQCSRGRWLPPVAIAAAAFVLSYFVKLSPLQVIGAAAIAGFFWVES